MTERILVFKGDVVDYDNYSREIVCLSDETCFQITDVDPTKVVGLGVRIIFCREGLVLVEGKELWSDGDNWIIKG